MAKKPVNATCPHCKGTGTLELKLELLQTIALFKRDSRFTSNEVLQQFIAAGKVSEKTTPNAMSNRLESLRQSGMLERVRTGRFYTYYKPRGGKKLTPPPPEGE